MELLAQQPYEHRLVPEVHRQADHAEGAGQADHAQLVDVVVVFFVVMVMVVSMAVRVIVAVRMVVVGMIVRMLVRVPVGMFVRVFVSGHVTSPGSAGDNEAQDCRGTPASPR